MNHRAENCERIYTLSCEGKGKRGLTWRSILKSHLKLATIELLYLFLNHDTVFRFIGRINRRGRIIESVFLAYPATEDYAFAYGYPHRLSRITWSPSIAGLLCQNGKVTVMFGISATDKELPDPANAENLKKLHDRFEGIRAMIGAKRKSFAGIIPGILYLRRIVRVAPEADLTASAVVEAVEMVKSKENMASDTEVVVLGGRGFIGRRVMALLDKNSSRSIDLAEGQGRNDLAQKRNGNRIVIVNITVNKAIHSYLDIIPPGSIIINEVYPELDKEVLCRLSEKNCICYHVGGIKGKSLPSFPSAYLGAIPCCADWPSSEMEVIVRKLN